MCWGQGQLPSVVQISENPEDQTCNSLGLYISHGFPEHQTKIVSDCCPTTFSHTFGPLAQYTLLSLGQYLRGFWVVENLINSRIILNT